MDRLQKKCFVGATGVHLLLLVLLLIGPAFLTSKSKVDPSPIMDVIPTRLIDAAFSGGGNPHGTPPPPAPPTPRPAAIVPPAPRPEPKPVKEPDPTPAPVKEVQEAKPDPTSLETNKDRNRKKPQVTTIPTVRKPDTGKKPKSPTTAQADDTAERQVAERNRRIAALLGATARTLRDDIAPGTSIDAKGPGGGGEVYGPYDQAVRSIYWHAWIPPEDTASDEAVTKASVTIASDGSVLSAHIIRASGDASVDRSVQRTLERVTFIAPFPEGAKEKQRTYTINFNLKAKRLSG
jgi:TonB family protein